MPAGMFNVRGQCTMLDTHPSDTYHCAECRVRRRLRLSAVALVGLSSWVAGWVAGVTLHWL